MLSKRVLVLGSSLPLADAVGSFALLLRRRRFSHRATVSNPIRSIRPAARYGASEKQWLTNPAAYAADKAHFNDYFNKFYFPDMTHCRGRRPRSIGRSRYKLFKKYLWATTNTQLQQDLTDDGVHRMKSMREIALAIPAYHPAVRYNAMLVIGMLDEQYANAPRSKLPNHCRKPPKR